jgi:RNA polymerase sigma factor (sigma-70 family)
MPDPDLPHLSPLLGPARSGDQDAFQHLAEPYRGELQLHCYRMLGSLYDAEDLVQETFLRAWRGLDRFEGRASFRGWLYRIATNACLNALASRSSARRLLPAAQAAPDDRQRVLLQRYVRAWEDADLDGFVALLRDDAVLSMPPMPQWFLGPDSIRTFFARAWRWAGPDSRRLIPAGANRQPAFAFYVRGPDDLERHAHSIWLPTLQDDAVAAITGFIDPRLFAPFGLPPILQPILPADGTAPLDRSLPEQTPPELNQQR